MILDGILFFAENMGQQANGCRYILEQSKYKVLFYNDKVEFILYGELEDDHIFLPLDLRNTDTYNEQTEMYLDAKDQMNIKINYMNGDKTSWIQDIPTYERICYHNVCDGINMEFYIENGCLKQDFIVFSDENKDDLKLRLLGVKDIYSGKDNEVIIVGHENMFQMETPYNYIKQSLE